MSSLDRSTCSTVLTPPKWSACLLAIWLASACSSSPGADNAELSRSGAHALDTSGDGQNDDNSDNDSSDDSNDTGGGTDSVATNENGGVDDAKNMSADPSPNATDNGTHSNDHGAGSAADDGNGGDDDANNTSADDGNNDAAMDAGTDTSGDGDGNGNSDDTQTDGPSDIGQSNMSLTSNTPPATVDPLNPANAPELCTPTSHDRCTNYVPQYALWSDNATKDRYVFLPRGEIGTADSNRWSFPKGTRFYKNFSDPKTNALIETRTITKVGESNAVGLESWDFKVYAWNGTNTPELMLHSKDKDEKTGEPSVLDRSSDAKYNNIGSTSHDIPSYQNCAYCHFRAGSDAVLGFSALQLDWPAAPYSLSRIVKDRGLNESLTGKIAGVPDSTAEYALGYLHANCGHCHSPGGRGSPQIGLSVDMAKSYENQPAVLHACSCDQYKDIVPKDVNSYIIKRMDRTAGPMPPIATKIADSDNIDKVKKWIGELSCTAAQIAACQNN